MKTAVVWKDAMEFSGIAGEHTVSMDAHAPIGRDKAATPKELVAMGLGGCTAMDVIALLKKYRQLPKSFSVEVDVTPSLGANPIVFESAVLTYAVEGDLDSERLIEAVRLSQTKYCGVSAMLSKALPIRYRIVLNGSEVGTGSAKFGVES